MIIELAIGAGIVFLGALVVRRRSAREPASEAEARDNGSETSVEAALAEIKRKAGLDNPKLEDNKTKKKRKKKEDEDPPERARAESPRGLRVSDVLLYADTELWLAGEIHLDEEGFALSVFTAPGGARATHIALLDPEAREVALLSETDQVPAGAVPAELPIDGLRVSLRRRGHADVRTEGEHLPLTTERAEYVILGGPGGKTLVVIDFAGGDRLALLGERLGREMYDLLPGGD